MTRQRREQARNDDESKADAAEGRRTVAMPPTIERMYDPDRESMLAALRIVLNLPRKIENSGGTDDKERATHPSSPL